MDLIGQITVIKRSGRDGATLDWQQDKSTLLIGRHEDCDIRVQLPTVSRRHASFVFDEKSSIVSIKDHSSVNTTTVNNIPIKGKTVIKHGDKITFGDRSFRFEYSSGSTPSTDNFDLNDSENVQPNTADLEGDATQDISKFVRINAPRAPRAKPLATVKETEAPAPAPAAPAAPVQKKSLPTPIKKSISQVPVKSEKKLKKVLNTPLKKNIKTFQIDQLRSRTLGTSVAVLDSFKEMCPTKKLPSPLRAAIVTKRKSLSSMYANPPKALPTPLKKQLKKTNFKSQKYAAPKASLQTPVKRAITELRRRKSLGLKKVAQPTTSTALPLTPNNLNAMAASASNVPLPESAVKATPGKTGAVKKALPTPVRMSINARLKKTPAKAKTPMSKPVKLPGQLLEAIRAKKNGDSKPLESTSVASKNTIDFVSDKLMVESYARELSGCVEAPKPVALSCALDAYMDVVSEQNSGEEETGKPLRSLPLDLRKSIIALNSETEEKDSTPLKSVAITVPPTPLTTDYGSDLETMFSQRPEDVQLIESSVKDFSEKAGLDEKAAYGYALDAYLEGVNEFWGHVETIQEEEEVEEEEEEEEEELPPMASDSSDLVVDVEKRQSLAKDLAKGLCDIFDEAAPKQSEIAATVAHSMCELLTSTAMENVKNKAEAAARVETIAEDMGDSLSALFKSAKKSKKRMSLAADMADSLSNLFELKEELEATSPKAAKKSQDKRKSLAADMAESLVGLFTSPAPVAMAGGKKTKADRRTSLAADMGASLDTLFSETSTEPVVEEIKETLTTLLSGSSQDDEETMKGSEIVANCLVELLETTASIVKEDEKKVKKTKVKGRRTSMKRVSLSGDIGDSLNNMFGEPEEDEEEEEAVATLLTDVEAVVDEIVSEVEEPTCDDKSLAIGQAVDVLLDGAVQEEEEEVVEEDAMEEEEVEEEEEVPDFKTLKVAELREECEKRGIDSTGIKKTLIKRLMDFVESPEPASTKRTIEEVDGEVAEKEVVKKADVEEAEDEESVEEVDFKSMKVAELRKECSSRNLDGKGTKAVLIKRLEEAVQGGGEEEESLEEEEEEEMDVDEVVDFKSLKVAELRKECESRNLDSKGTKALLIKRLEEADQGGGEEIQESSEEESEGEEETIDFKSMKVAELRAECSKRDLDTKGVKAVLIKRLEAAC
ncbi:hypothetical protein TrST_g297 [Triparma strigata]|uniref:FHA domain-containing protein n=1 Tax=Triparma strigata TaxID=1606541 RepID=A0A9W7B0A5_9STRA|nr:hypothetical protein TrST_g297 [Triparma strigata]